MDLPHIALLPCRLMLWLAALLVSRDKRSDFCDEWYAEVWHRWLVLEGHGENLYAGAIGLYSFCAGCFFDAWWHFSQQGEMRLRGIEWTRSPGFCIGALFGALTVLTLLSGFLPATRLVLTPLPYESAGRIAVISRTGRMELMRRGIPEDLALAWKKKSKLVSRLAACSFPKTVTIKTLSGPRQAVAIGVSANFFSTLGVSINGPEGASAMRYQGVWLTEQFWRMQLHSNARLAGERIEINGRELVVKGILPAGFWFLSPSVALYEVNAEAVPAQSMLVVRCREGVSTGALERELSQVAERGGYEFARTAPHAMFLRDAVATPLWLFASALFVAITLAVMAYGSRWLNHQERGRPALRGHWRWWRFFVLKTAPALLFVLLCGMELFIGGHQQAVTEALGGPALLWFYLVGCTIVLFASISDQQSRCRVCQRLLGFPIRIGCPGCLFLEWAGTEFLCPEGHGVLYVPHHVTCWEEADRWILLEV
jgi:hypothetical protein